MQSQHSKSYADAIGRPSSSAADGDTSSDTSYEFNGFLCHVPPETIANIRTVIAEKNPGGPIVDNKTITAAVKCHRENASVGDDVIQGATKIILNNLGVSTTNHDVLYTDTSTNDNDNDEIDINHKRKGSPEMMSSPPSKKNNLSFFGGDKENTPNRNPTAATANNAHGGTLSYTLDNACGEFSDDEMEVHMAGLPASIFAGSGSNDTERDEVDKAESSDDANDHGTPSIDLRLGNEKYWYSKWTKRLIKCQKKPSNVSVKEEMSTDEFVNQMCQLQQQEEQHEQEQQQQQKKQSIDFMDAITNNKTVSLQVSKKCDDEDCSDKDCGNDDDGQDNIEKTKAVYILLKDQPICKHCNVKPATTKPRSNAQGKSPNDTCHECSKKEGIDCYEKPGACGCNAERFGTCKDCKDCAVYSKECANFEECNNNRDSNGRQYCLQCIRNDVPGRDKQCSNKNCDNVGLRGKDSVCRECSNFDRRRENFRNKKCKRCEEPMFNVITNTIYTNNTGSASSFCNRDECEHKCRFRHNGTLCTNTCDENGTNKSGEKAYHPFCPEHNKHRCTYPNCSSAYNQKSHLTQHIRKVHEPDSMYECPYFNCSSKYKKKRELTTHIKKVHEKNGKYKCEYPNCTREHKNWGAMNTHIKKDHK